MPASRKPASVTKPKKRLANRQSEASATLDARLDWHPPPLGRLSVSPAPDALVVRPSHLAPRSPAAVHAAPKRRRAAHRPFYSSASDRRLPAARRFPRSARMDPQMSAELLLRLRAPVRKIAGPASTQASPAQRAPLGSDTQRHDWPLGPRMRRSPRLPRVEKLRSGYVRVACTSAAAILDELRAPQDWLPSPARRLGAAEAAPWHRCPTSPPARP